MDWKESLNNMRIEKKFDPNKWVNEKCRKFNSYLKENDINGAILSVSGGIDSAVTLALLKYTMEMENSNLKQICAISQPINSSDWAFNRAKELCNKFGIKLITIDQTDIHELITKKVENELNYKSNVFSKGQLKSYMRTPINYYIAQTLNEQDSKNIVIGTGNKDEDGYLGYFCKYGDGAVDLQLINDLHKSEVFKVGEFLKIPESILNAPPSADLWEGQEDEIELGLSYDFIEFYTAYYLKLDNNDKIKFISNLKSESKNEFNNFKIKCDDIHNRNKHKFNGVINL
jgi:NAD+ synthase (glutamine-hydrolysing)